LANNAKDLDPTTSGLVCDFIGPPGSGKSTLARSALQLGKGFAFVAPQAEIMSYTGHDLDYTPLIENDWNPAGERYQANAYKDMMKQLAELEKRDDLKVVIFDTMSAGPSEAVWTAIMSSYGTANVQKVNNPYAPYVTYALWMTDVLNRIDLLRFRKKVHVIKLWHGDLKELEGLGTARKELVGGKMEVHWDLAMQAEMKGRQMPQAITKWSEVAFFCEAVPNSNPFKCRLQAIPDNLRMAKTRIPGLQQALQKLPEIPNDYPKLLETIRSILAKK